MFNFVSNLANNLSAGLPSNNTNVALAGSDINLNINIMGNADNNVVNKIRDTGKQLLTDLKKELNKSGIYK